MVNITVSLSGSNGDTLAIDNENYVLETGLTGFGIPAPVLRIDKSSSNGGVFRYSKRDVRTLDLPISIIANEGEDIQVKLRRLAAILRGPVTLTVNYDSGEAFYIVGYFNGGAETQFGKAATHDYCRWVISLECPQPFWTSVVSQSFNVSAISGVKGLLAASSGISTLSRLQVKSSQALGALAIENLGDVEAPVRWQIKGPSTNVTISSNGFSFSYTETLTAADTITIDTEKGTVVNAAGVNKYAYLGSAPKLFSIQPGVSTISITAVGSDANTKISGNFQPRREVIH